MIYISEKVRIVRLDGLNLQLEELAEVRNKKTGETRYEWKWHGYYGDLRSAFVGALNKQLFDLADGDIKKTLQTAVDEIDKCKANIAKALKELKENNNEKC